VTDRSLEVFVNIDFEKGLSVGFKTEVHADSNEEVVRKAFELVELIYSVVAVEDLFERSEH